MAKRGGAGVTDIVQSGAGMPNFGRERAVSNYSKWEEGQAENLGGRVFEFFDREREGLHHKAGVVET